MTFTRNLGRSGIAVSALGMGCWAIGGPFWDGDNPLGWGEVDDAESIRAIHRALELGVNFFDTANVYGAGHSERVLGQAFEGKRQDVIIASKFSSLFNEETRQVTGNSAEPASIRQACEDTLRRLNTDYLDLYQFHDNGYPADQAAPVLETLEALVSAGKIRQYGWSTDFPDRAEVFAQGKNCTSIQFQCNVLDDNPAVTAICEKYNLASINRGPLAMGLLTGKYSASTKPSISDVRGEKSPDWMVYFKDGKPSPEWLSKMESVRSVLTSDGRTLAQGSIAWLWARSPLHIPIPGFRTVAQVEDNCGALEKGPLTPDQMQEIDQILNA